MGSGEIKTDEKTFTVTVKPFNTAPVMLTHFHNLKVVNYHSKTFEMPEIYDRELEDSLTATWTLTDKN